jgi:hypothetical protein
VPHWRRFEAISGVTLSSMRGRITAHDDPACRRPRCWPAEPSCITAAGFPGAHMRDVLGNINMRRTSMTGAVFPGACQRYFPAAYKLLRTCQGLAKQVYPNVSWGGWEYRLTAMVVFCQLSQSRKSAIDLSGRSNRPTSPSYLRSEPFSREGDLDSETETVQDSYTPTDV